jgi:hypothetical protein
MLKFIKINDIFKSIKDSLKTDQDWINEELDANHFLREGDWNRFKNKFNSKNKYINFNSLACEVSVNGNLELFKKLEMLAKSENKIDNLFYENTFNWSISRNNIDIIKYLFVEKLHSTFSIDDFKIAINNSATQVIDFALYDLNIQINENLNIWIESISNTNLKTKTHDNIFEKIQKRDLFFNLTKNLISTNHVLKKINKL